MQDLMIEMRELRSTLSIAINELKKRAETRLKQSKSIESHLPKRS